MKLGLLYETTSNPWGGVNTFFRNFKRYAGRDHQVELNEDLRQAQIIITDGRYRGPGKRLRQWHLKNAAKHLPISSPFGRFFIDKPKALLLFRLDGLRQIYAPLEVLGDTKLITNLVLADYVVFQSQFGRECFDKTQIEYPPDFQVIFNGADEQFFFPAPNRNSTSERRQLRLVSNSWSTNHEKGFETIAKFSTLDRVETLHIGRWPDNVNSENVKLLGVKQEAEIGNIYRGADYLLFPSEKDTCPNVVVEALACGLPVIYHPSGGTPELCSKDRFGLPFSYDRHNKIQLKQTIDLAKTNLSSTTCDVKDNHSSFQFLHCYKQYINFISRVIF